jgi:gamma-glutamylputrescine oxidase
MLGSGAPVPDAQASLYVRTSPVEAGPPLTRSLKAEVAIIGAGYTGLWTALELLALGLSPVILEARTVGFGASGRNGGQAIPGWRKGLPELVRQFGRERAVSLFGAALEARDAVLDLIDAEAIDCELVAGGHLTLAARPRDARPLQEEADALRHMAGYRAARFISSVETAEFLPAVRSAGGLFDESGFHLHPLKYAQGLARTVRCKGGLIFENSPVVALAKEADSVRLTTPDGEIVAKHAVLACDALLGNLYAPIASKIMPVAAYQVATEVLADPSPFIRRGVAVSDSRFAVNYYRMSADGRLVFGGGERYTQRPPADVSAFVRPFLDDVFPNARDLRIEHAWGGLVSITRSRLPDVGRHGPVWFAHGFSGQGVLLTALAGQAIAQAISGHSAAFRLLDRLAPLGFPGGSALRAPLHVAGMLYHAARDRL